MYICMQLLLLFGSSTLRVRASDSFFLYIAHSTSNMYYIVFRCCTVTQAELQQRLTASTASSTGLVCAKKVQKQAFFSSADQWQAANAIYISVCVCFRKTAILRIIPSKISSFTLWFYTINHNNNKKSLIFLLKQNAIHFQPGNVKKCSDLTK